MNKEEKDKRLKELWNTFLKPISEQDLYGDYVKPQILTKVESLVQQGKIDTGSLGFYFDHILPHPEQSIDIIPFATTGVGGNYYSFLTGFDTVEKLEDAPIVVYLDGKCTFIARNILDFFSIVSQIFCLGIVENSDPRYINFDEFIADFLEDEVEDADEIKETSKVLRDNLPIEPIDNLNEYYSKWFEEREHSIGSKNKFNRITNIWMLNQKRYSAYISYHTLDKM